MLRRKPFLLCLLLIGPAWLVAKDFWDQPFQKWKREDVLRLINDSPWAQSQTFDHVEGKGAGASGEKELFYKCTVRFFSARPVREAYVRLMQLMNKYDDMAPEQRQQFDARFQRALNLDTSDRVIVALEYATNDPNVARDLRAALETARTDTLKQSVYLISQRLGRVELREYFPPSADGTGAKFIFPRTVKGQPVLAPEDKEIRFDFFVPAIEQRLFVTFKTAKMTYRDELTY